MSKDKWNDHTRRDSRLIIPRVTTVFFLAFVSIPLLSLFIFLALVDDSSSNFSPEFCNNIAFPPAIEPFLDPRNCFFFVSFNRPLIALQMEKESRRRSNSVSSRMDTLEGILGELRRAVAE